MLAIDRKVDQTLVINGDIEITVLHIGLSKVQFGITAPYDVYIEKRARKAEPVDVSSIEEVAEDTPPVGVSVAAGRHG